MCREKEKKKKGKKKKRGKKREKKKCRTKTFVVQKTPPKKPANTHAHAPAPSHVPKKNTLSCTYTINEPIRKYTRN